MSRYTSSVLSVEQVKRLLQAAQGHPLEAFWAVALVTGMRRGELLALRWHDIDFESGWISLRRELSILSLEEQALKQAEKRRDIPLSPQLSERLQQHRRAQQEMQAQAGHAWSEHDLVFSDPRASFLHVHPFDLFNALQELAGRAGLFSRSFHDLRASTAFLLLNAGIHSFVVEKLLGHSAMYTSPGPIALALLQDAINTLSTQLLSVDEGEEAPNRREKGRTPS